MTLPSDPQERKSYPIATGLIDYFPKALAEVAHVSWVGNEQHHPGDPLHWDRSKSADEADALMRHFVARGTIDSDGTRHTAKVAWRALAMLEKELERVADMVKMWRAADSDAQPDAPSYDALRDIDDETVDCDGARYYRAGVLCCNHVSSHGYLCTLPTPHTGQHCATDTWIGDEKREWD